MTTHKHKLYRTWKSMFDRCYNPAHEAHPNYGGRGITICERWRNFDHFVEDVGERPTGHSIDRIDNDGNYEPDNVRWATRQQQANNRRTNRIVEYDGQSLTIAEWARRTGIPQTCIWKRIFRQGWSPEDALTTPLKQGRPLITFNGKTQSVREWSDELGITYNTIIYRLDEGWPLEKVFCPQKNIVMKRTPKKRSRKPYYVSHHRGKDRYYLYVRDESGERQYFGSHKTRQDAVEVAERHIAM